MIHTTLKMFQEKMFSSSMLKSVQKAKWTLPKCQNPSHIGWKTLLDKEKMLVTSIVLKKKKKNERKTSSSGLF